MESQESIIRFMNDLVPQDMMTVEIPPGEQQTFYLYVDKAPATVKLAFAVQADREDSAGLDDIPIDFKVRQSL